MTMTCENRISRYQTSQDNANSNVATDASSNATGRDGKGRFARGNSGGPGNPFARQVGQLRKVLLECVSEDDMANIARVLIMLAKEGNLQAIKLLFQYTLGKPAETINPDRLDVDEAERFEETATMQKGLAQSALAPDPEFALEMVRALRPALAKSSGGRYLGLMEADAAAERERADAELKEAIRGEQRRQKAKARRAGNGAPSTNGVEAGALPANGVEPRAPSTNGLEPEASPGGLQPGTPSTNGNRRGSESQLPSPNGENGCQDTDAPSANGKKALMQQMSDLLRMVTGRNGRGDGLAP